MATENDPAALIRRLRERAHERTETAQRRAQQARERVRELSQRETLGRDAEESGAARQERFARLARERSAESHERAAIVHAEAARLDELRGDTARAGTAPRPIAAASPHRGTAPRAPLTSAAISSSVRPGVTLEELKEAVALGAIDTVVLAMADMQGRLQGKRLTASFFLDEILDHGAECCNYLLAVDVDMNTVGGYAMSSWERGYGDMVLVPDLGTLRTVPWQEGTAICLADVAWHDRSDVLASPRQILRRQLARLAERGWSAYAGTELEFLVFRDTYEEAWQRRYRDLQPANLYNVDYSLLGTARVEPLIRRIRNSMSEAGMAVEDSKGECNAGQHEINFHYTQALQTADEHVVFKNGAKEIAALEGMAITFIAKYDQREGNSCHLHFSLADDAGPLFARDERTFHAFLAGQLACLREMTLLLAPNVNSYKRYAAGSFAPTTVAWGEDNRTCALRVVGRGPSLRFENRVGGADLNPYLALSAVIASGLHGVDAGLELEPAFEGSAYAASDRPRVPATLREARELFAASTVARDAFGEDVVAHYLNAADVELAAFDVAVTDWELVRGFERL